jgi:hypothetical protein
MLHHFYVQKPWYGSSGPCLHIFKSSVTELTVMIFCLSVNGQRLADSLNVSNDSNAA